MLPRHSALRPFTVFVRRVATGVLAALIFGAPAGAATLEQAERELQRGNYNAAVGTLQALAQDGDPQAQVRLGSLYQKGEGVARDAKKARELYTEAAQRGNADALYNLGNLYLMGEGVQQDDGWALTYYRQAAAQGHALAQKNMEQLYRAAGIDPANVGAPPAARASTSRAMAPADTAAEVPAPTAGGQATYSEDELRAIQLARSHGILVDLSKVASGSAGDDTSGVIAESQQEGAALGVDVSESGTAAPVAPPSLDAVKAELARASTPPEAVKQLGALAAAGSGEAQFMMFERLADKRNREYDEVRALQWLQRAAETGYPEAEFRLAEKYFHGQGVAPDEAAAITLYRSAAAAGHTAARERLKAIYRDAGVQPPSGATSGAPAPVDAAPRPPGPAGART